LRKISKLNIDIKAWRNSPLETSKIKREFVAVFIKSPLYCTIPLKRSIELIKFFSQRFVSNPPVKAAATVADGTCGLTDGSMAGSGCSLPRVKDEKLLSKGAAS
jgi:hypothetical protein